MSLYISEIALALRRMSRRQFQNVLLLITFIVCFVLCLVSWSLFDTVFLTQPKFDPDGAYYVMSYSNAMAASNVHSTQEEIDFYRQNQKVFDDFAPIVFYSSAFIKTPDGAERSLVSYISNRALKIAGAQPLLGRLFTSSEDEIGGPPTAILSERIWVQSYSRNPEILGKVMVVNGRDFTIVGVLPSEFRFPNDQDVWLSYGSAPNQPRFPIRDALVRLSSNITFKRAEQDLRGILKNMPGDSQARTSGLIPTLLPIRDFYLGSELRASARVVATLAIVFFLASCVNAANLILINFLGARGEMATTLALGIPIAANVRALIYQVGVLIIAALLVSLPCSIFLGEAIFNNLDIINAPYWLRFNLNIRYVLIGVGVAFACGCITLIAPAAYSFSRNVEKFIGSHAKSLRGASKSVWRRILLAFQMGMLMILGVASCLLLSSIDSVRKDTWGYNAGVVFSAKISNLGMEFPYAEPARSIQRLNAHRKALDSVKQRAETDYAALTDNPPGYSQLPNCRYAGSVAELLPKGSAGRALSSRITEDYFSVLGVSFLQGRSFPVGAAPDVSVVNAIPVVVTKSLADRLWRDENQVDRALYIKTDSASDAEPPMKAVVIGVVANFQASGPLALSNDAIFLPFDPAARVASSLTLLVRDRGGVSRVSSVENAIRRIQPFVAVYLPSTLERQILQTLSSLRMAFSLAVPFAISAFLLCSIGIYTITQSQMLQSRRNLGIEMALGLTPAKLWLKFCRSHLFAAASGVIIGTILALGVSRVLSSILYGPEKQNIYVYVAVGFGILLISLCACLPSYFTLRRMDPAESLRSV